MVCNFHWACTYCSIPRCRADALSCRAKYCRACFKKRASSANRQRKTCGGNSTAYKNGIGNKGNSTAYKNGIGNAGNSTAYKNGIGNAGNRSKGKHRSNTHWKRSALRRSTKRVLVVKQPWLDLILKGEKTWEIRGTVTNVRGTIHLAQSQAGGKLMGQCRIINCCEIEKKILRKHFDMHRIPGEKFKEVNYAKLYVWKISHAKRYKKPFSFEHPTGAVIWVRL